jgi:hypothetical protein
VSQTLLWSGCQDLARHLLHELANEEGRAAFASPSACVQLVELLSTDR